MKNMSSRPSPILVTGATGYVGALLAERLAGRGHEVRAMSRRPDARVPDRTQRVIGDVESGEGLRRALDGTGTAFYLVHAMGAGSDFAERDRAAARTFARAAREAGVRRVVYLGGLGPTGEDASEHLRSRAEVADILAGELSGTAEVAHVRAAMIVGSGSISFQMLHDLVCRLPAMVCPRWVNTRSQPVAVDDVLDALIAAAEEPAVPGELQIGGADVLTYREMMVRFARAAGRRAPVMVHVPLLTPRLSSYWVRLVTDVEPGVARPLVEGLSAETVVTAPAPPPFNPAPMGFDEAVERALAG